MLALIAIPPLMGFAFAESFYRAMAVLVAASPPDVTVTLYPAGRHEILNETNRGEVTADIVAWLRAHAA